MTTPRLLALSGKMASGKDAVAEVALTTAGFSKILRLKIADAIRHTLNEYLELNRTDPHAIPVKLDTILAQVPSAQYDIAAALTRRLVDLFTIVTVTEPQLSANDRTNTSRALLQDLARLYRLADPDIWVKIHIQRLREITDPVAVVLTTDVREPNEVLALRRSGYLMVRIVINPEIQIQRLRQRDSITVDPLTLNHPNETALDRIAGEVADAFDAFIDNNGSLDVAASTLAVLLKEKWGQP
jgi:dephospho-CoA kinase